MLDQVLTEHAVWMERAYTNLIAENQPSGMNGEHVQAVLTQFEVTLVTTYE